jgi:hypothetical protein
MRGKDEGMEAGRRATNVQQPAARKRREENAVVDLISGPDDDDAAHPDEFVESVRQALRPLHSAMLARAKGASFPSSPPSNIM